MSATKPIATDTISPICSVVIPTHNCLGYLRQALESVRLQPVSAMEILVVDDNSSDGTWPWLLEQHLADPRIRPLRCQMGHPGAARNLALQAARGRFVAFLDADDGWAPDKLAPQLAYHQHHAEVVMSFTDYRHLGPQGEDRGTCFEFWQSCGLATGQGYRQLPEPQATLLGRNLVGTSTVMARRDALLACGGFDDSLPSAEDWDLWLKLSRYGRVAVTSRCQSWYLMRPGSETSQAGRRIRAMRQVMQRHQQGCGWQAKRWARARIATAQAELALAQQQPWHAWWQHLQACTLVPSRRHLRALLEPVLARF
ncbi:glycosyltransferase family 2 protein [Ferrimonas marina]|uniref:Glycosyl transferase family 2 n=1 Tax=Ferrimonas marina TaxID=299255 RepID=A0A1M5RTF1_9GAMM|nr:glycosyltransferase family 2 protein [Ferrimonas marina]SHH29113.1 Glycosyl transferase family 2 [Ferrimonas marina]